MQVRLFHRKPKLKDNFMSKYSRGELLFK